MTYYEILEVSNTASEEVIRMAYKALARKYHPDVFSGDPQFADQKMKQLNEAFEVLSDPQQRVSYDQKLRNRHKETTTQNSSTNNSSDFDDKNDHFFKCSFENSIYKGQKTKLHFLIRAEKADMKIFRTETYRASVMLKNHGYLHLVQERYLLLRRG